MATAIIWCLITQLSDVDRENDAVQRFMAYARENYVNTTSGANVVDAYLDIKARLIARQEQSKQEAAIAAASAPLSVEVQSHDGPKVGHHAKPVDVLCCEIRDAVWAADGGLQVALHIPRDLAKKLLHQSV
jgi:hypothetical protein